MARTRPFVKIHLSVADHRKTAAVWADPRMRGMLVELWRKACEKYAGHLGDRVMLKPTDRMEIAGTTDQREADEAVSSLCRALKYRLTRHPNRWEAHIRKFSKKQGFESKELDKNSTTTPASETPIPKLRNSETPNAESAPPEAPSAPHGNPWPLLNAIATYEGEQDEKRAWLEHEYPLIQAETDAGGNPKRIVSIAIRYYRNYLKGERQFKNWAAKQETARRMAEHEARCLDAMRELEAEEGYEAAHR